MSAEEKELVVTAAEEEVEGPAIIAIYFKRERRVCVCVRERERERERERNHLYIMMIAK